MTIHTELGGVNDTPPILPPSLPMCRYSVAEGRGDAKHNRTEIRSTSLSDGTLYRAVYIYLSVNFY